MSLITAFINNPVKVAVAVLLLVLFGLLAVFEMPVELTPKVEKQWLSVRTNWPGAGPEEVEREIVYEQERHLNAIPGMKEITSNSSNSRASVEMNFAINADMNEAMVKVNARLQQVSKYPETALEPTIRSGTDDTSTIAIFNVIPRPPDDLQLQRFASEHPELAELTSRIRQVTSPTLVLQQIRDKATQHPELNSLLPNDMDIVSHTRFVEDHVATALGRIDGIARTWVWGGQQDEMRVTIDPSKLAVLNLTLTDVRDTLRNRNHDTPAGQLNEGKRRFDVRVMGRYTNPEQIKREVLTVVNGTQVTVGDVAEVELKLRSQQDSAASHFDTRSLRMGITKESGANLLEIMTEIRRISQELNEGVLRQRGLLLYQTYDDTEYVNEAISTVQFNMLLGALLTIVVLLLFLRSGRSTLIVGTAIPVSIIGTFLCLRLLDRSLNVVSMAGMSFAIGMLVDNAVVVLENIYRHHQKGLPPFEAARRGTTEVWGATLASTLTTLAVFIPILFIREEAGQLFRDIALAISCGVGLSLLVSVIVIPTAAARILRQTPLAMDPDGITKLVGIRRFFAILLVPVDWVAQTVARLVVSVNHRIQSRTSLQLLSVVIFVGGGVALTWALIPPVEYLPSGNRNSVRGRLVPPPGYNIEQIQTIADACYDHVRPHIEFADAADSNQTDNSTLSTDVPLIADYTFGAYNGKGYVSVKAKDPQRAHELVGFMKTMTDAIPGVEAFVSQTGIFQGGWGSSSRQIEVHIVGPDLDRLVELGVDVRSRVIAQIPGASVYPLPSLEMSKPELRVEPKKLRVAESGLTTDQIGYTVDAYIDSAFADKYILDGDEIDLSIAIQDDYADDMPLEEVPIPTANGEILPLSALADVRLASGLDSIRHINRERAITLRVSPPEDVPLATAIQTIEEEIVGPLERNGDLDGLYRVSLSGSADQLRETWSALRINFLIAILITYLLMAALFESWSYPLVIMVSLPLAAVGGILGLRVVGLFTLQHLDILTMLGFVILVGTVVNNPILIVHQALTFMRRDGMDADQAVVESVSTRIRPIFMTTITTTFGLLPLVIFNGAGSELYRGLGSVVLGGLIVSTVFTLFLVPSLFSLMHSVMGVSRTTETLAPDFSGTEQT